MSYTFIIVDTVLWQYKLSSSPKAIFFPCGISFYPPKDNSISILPGNGRGIYLISFRLSGLVRWRVSHLFATWQYCFVHYRYESDRLCGDNDDASDYFFALNSTLETLIVIILMRQTLSFKRRESFSYFRVKASRERRRKACLSLFSSLAMEYFLCYVIGTTARISRLLFPEWKERINSTLIV